jgi:hypothetical protein
MVQILQFVLPDHTFDAEATAALIAAYDKAIKELHDRGQPELVREVIAKRIIAATAAGERDPRRLCEVGLAGLQTTH